MHYEFLLLEHIFVAIKQPNKYLVQTELERKKIDTITQTMTKKFSCLLCFSDQISTGQS
jgi:hypothetical protein